MHKSLWIALVAAALGTAGAVRAEPALMLGATLKFGGNSGKTSVGMTAKILSDNRKDRGVAALGLSWYPGQSQQFGIDVGLGYVFDGGALTAGYDFIDRAPALGLGWVDSKNPPAPAPPPVVETIAD